MSAQEGALGGPMAGRLARTLAGAWAQPWAGPVALLALLSLVSMYRPLLPVDETRYAAVAWEMWTRDDFLVPTLNGQPYHHKPPLLFWLMQAGWAVFGVNEWWPRLLSPLFGAGTLVLTARLGQALWPDQPEVARIAPCVLVSSVLFSYLATALMFDALLGFFVALGYLGLVRAWRGGLLKLWCMMSNACRLPLKSGMVRATVRRPWRHGTASTGKRRVEFSSPPRSMYTRPAFVRLPAASRRRTRPSIRPKYTECPTR